MYLVQIDFEGLIRNLIAQDTGQSWDLHSAKAWLRDAGFTEHDDGWLCDEQALAKLDPTEVRTSIRL